VDGGEPLSRRHGADLGGARLRILSFGCSNGQEVLSLRSYFPDAIIFACDVNLGALHEAAETLAADEAILFVSSDVAIAAHGPYDVVFAMSVLCRFPESADPALQDLSSLYSFAAFTAATSILAGNLDPGGLLCIYNANYDFLATPGSRGFRPVRSPLIPGSGFVDRFGADGKRQTLCEKLGSHYVHRVCAGARPHAEPDCLFERDGDEAGEWVAFDDIAPPQNLPPPALMRFGPDLDACARTGLIASALGYWVLENGPQPLLVRAWFHATADGIVRRGRPWAVRAGHATAQLAIKNPEALPPAPVTRSRRPLGVLRFAAQRLRGMLSDARAR
jgi:hypothetical protein